MRKILLVYTGGTIGSSFDKEKNCRVLCKEISKMTLISKYMEHNPTDIFCDSGLCEDDRLLSENMTYEKLNKVIEHIRKADWEKYLGIIILHGSDTIAYTAALFSFVFSNCKIPIMLVCGQRPPEDKDTNAHINFKTAADLILGGIAPNVYVPYQNSDGKIWLHLGTSIMQCRNYSDDFFGVSVKKSFCLNNGNIQDILLMCQKLSRNRTVSEMPKYDALTDGVLLISPYMGLDYSNYNLDSVKAVVHGSYHSGTACVERNNETGAFSTHSLLWFANECERKKIPIFLAPSNLGSEQYSSVLDLAKNSNVVLLNMTTESTYAKLLLGTANNLSNEQLYNYMQKEICNEFYI